MKVQNIDQNVQKIIKLVHLIKPVSQLHNKHNLLYGDNNNELLLIHKIL